MIFIQQKLLSLHEIPIEYEHENRISIQFLRIFFRFSILVVVGFRTQNFSKSTAGRLNITTSHSHFAQQRQIEQKAFVKYHRK